MGGMYVPDIIPQEDREMYEKAGHGERMGFGKKAAILVVDVTQAFIDPKSPLAGKDTGRIVEAIRELLAKARAKGIPILYTTPNVWRSKLEEGRWSDKMRIHAAADSPIKREDTNLIVDEVAPRQGDIIIFKDKPSAFFGSALVSYLTLLNVDTLVVTGLTTSGCVRATVVDAFSYNYRVIVPLECVGDRGRISHEVNLFDMDMKYADVTPLREVLDHLDRVSSQDPNPQV